MLQIETRQLRRAFLIDDNPEVRAGYSLIVEDLDLEPKEITERIDNITQLASQFDPSTDCVICDFQLKSNKYSNINGDVLVSALFDQRIAAILCSRFSEVKSNLRNLRRRIPSIVSPQHFSPDTFKKGLHECIREHAGIFSAERKLWRTIVRVESAEMKSDEILSLYAMLPGWDHATGIEVDVRIHDNPVFQKIRDRVASGETYRGKVYANIGAKEADEVFIDRWEDA